MVELVPLADWYPLVIRPMQDQGRRRDAARIADRGAPEVERLVLPWQRLHLRPWQPARNIRRLKAQQICHRRPGHRRLEALRMADHPRREEAPVAPAAH